MPLVVNKRTKRSKVWIYGLFDPRDGTMRYVGMAMNAKTRWSQYKRFVGSNRYLSRWLLGLADEGLEPIMRLLGVVIGFSGNCLIDECLSRGAEHRLIARARIWPTTRHTLLNGKKAKKLKVARSRT